LVKPSKIESSKGENQMRQRKVLVGLMIACFFLVGTSSAMAALWDLHCQVAIEDLQRLQQEIAVKKQEIDAVRVVKAIPSNFVSGQLQESIDTYNDGSQGVNELKFLFQNVEFAVAEFSRSCLKSHRVSQ